MKNIIFILTLFITISSFSQNQNATLFFKDGTNIKGLASIKTSTLPRSSKSIKFRVKKRSKKEIFDYTTVERIIFTDEWDSVEYCYKTIENSKTPKLLEVLIKGEMSLYSIENISHRPPLQNTNGTMMTSGNFYSKITYYVSKKEEKIVTPIATIGAIANSYKKTAIKYFNDCPKLIDKIKSKEFNKNNIEKAVIFYNENCGKSLNE